MEDLGDTLDTIENENSEFTIVFYEDMNGRTGTQHNKGEEDEEEAIIFENTNLNPKRESLDSKTNERGKILKSTLDQHGLYLLNGRTPGDIPGSYTYIIRMSKTIIDYFCINAGNLDRVNELKVLEMATGADHMPLQLELLELCTAIQTKGTARPKQRGKSARLKWNNSKQEEYQKIIHEWAERKNKDDEKEDGDTLCWRLQKTINKTATTLKLKQYPRNKPIKHKN